MSIKKWYDSIGTKNGIFDVEDIKAFRFATGVLICSIVNHNKKHMNDELADFCNSFKKEQGLSDEEAKRLYEEVEDFDANLEKQIAVIKSQLKDSSYKKLEFMHTLNRFIIEDDCDDEHYSCFETIIEKLFAKE
jgi:hypothetical protein